MILVIQAIHRVYPLPWDRVFFKRLAVAAVGQGVIGITHSSLEARAAAAAAGATSMIPFTTMLELWGAIIVWLPHVVCRLVPLVCSGMCWRTLVVWPNANSSEAIGLGVGVGLVELEETRQMYVGLEEVACLQSQLEALSTLLPPCLVLHTPAWHSSIPGPITWLVEERAGPIQGLPARGGLAAVAQALRIGVQTQCLLLLGFPTQAAEGVVLADTLQRLLPVAQADLGWCWFAMLSTCALPVPPEHQQQELGVLIAPLAFLESTACLVLVPVPNARTPRPPARPRARPSAAPRRGRPCAVVQGSISSRAPPPRACPARQAARRPTAPQRARRRAWRVLRGRFHRLGLCARRVLLEPIPLHLVRRRVLLVQLGCL